MLETIEWEAIHLKRNHTTIADKFARHNKLNPKKNK